MAYRDTDDLVAKLARLSTRERQVLQYRCLGWDYEQIAKTLFITERSVKTYVNRIYNKLELKGYGRAARLKLLYEEYCPLLQELEPRLGQPAAGSKIPIIEGEVQEEAEEFLSSEDEQILEEDQYAIVPFRPAPMIPPHPTRRRRWGLVGLVAGVILGVCVGGTAVYLGLRTILRPVPVGTPATLTMLPPMAQPTQTVAEAPLAEPPTQTPYVLVVTSTPIPATALPTPIPFIPPADGILFQDNFENGINPEWKTYSSDWLVSNGQLTLSTNAAFNEKFNWIELDHPEWKNYAISLYVQMQTGQLSPFGWGAIVVRKGSSSNDIGVIIDTLHHIFWAYIASNGSRSEAIAGRNGDYSFYYRSNVQIIVNGNNYTIQVEGQDVQTISIEGHDSGGIALGIECQYALQCPSFDNVKVTYLP